MGLKRKLFTAITMFALTCAMLLVGVWAVSSTSIEIGGTISFSATNVNATVSGSITGSSAGTITPTTLTYSSTQTPTTEALNTWKNNLSFDEAGNKITMTIMVNNLSSERKLYVTLTDTAGEITNLTKSVKQGANAYTSGTEVEVIASGSATFTIEFTVGSTDSSMDGTYGYTISLKDQNAPIELNSDKQAKSLTYELDDNTNTASVTGYDESVADVVIPSQVIYDGKVYAVTSIGTSAFSGSKGLISVTIPSNVTNIGTSAFMSCSALTNMNYLGTLKNWVSMSFGNDYSNPTYYTKSLKIQGQEITSVTAQDLEGVTSIGSFALYNCSAITSIEIPNGMTSIGEYAFQGCIGLTSIEIPDSVTSIGEDAFSKCSGLASVQMGNGVQSIEASTFSNCIALTSIEIPESVTSIGQNAFHNCGFTSIEIPDNVTSMGANVFMNCSSLRSVKIGSGVQSIEAYTFSNCSALISITIPNNVTSIGTYAFRDCTSLASVVIENGVTSIEMRAFDGCAALTSIEIPESVTSVGTKAFMTCSMLKTIIIDSETIASGLTAVSSQGYLINNATTIYIKTEIVNAGKVGSYVTDAANYPNVETITTGEYAGYTRYSK